jgi:hypothetical protein
MPRRLVPSLAGALAIVAAAATVAFAQTPAGAPQTFPTTASHTVVPDVSIGGLKLGMNYADMVKRWGTGSSCGAFDANAGAGNGLGDDSTFTGVCYWSDPSLGAGAAQVNFRQGVIDDIDIDAAHTTKNVPTATGPIGQYTITHGNKKFRMGSTIASFKKAFPKYQNGQNTIQLVKGDVALNIGASHGKISELSLLVSSDF